VPYFDQKKADFACNFFEGLLKHTADEYWGKPFKLAPWEEDALQHIFGWHNDDGTWLTSMAYLEVPKKAGKTEWAAGCVLMALTLAEHPGCQVYGAAAALKQARNVYRAACKMVEQSQLIGRRLRIMRGTDRIVKRSDPDSFYAAIAADGDFSDGFNPYFTVADELHRWRTRKQMENWDVISLSGITRRQSMTLAITTAGVQSESPLAWRLHEKTEKAAKGVVSDPRFYGRIYGAQPGDDPADERTWIKAHPSLKENGGFLDISKLREEYETALSDPEGIRAFKRYFLNIWDEKANRAIDILQWDACQNEGDWVAAGLIPRPPEDIVRPLSHDLMARFVDRPCWLGVDVSFTTDMSAVTAVFPPENEDGDWDVLPFFWMPAATIRKREIQDGMPYRTWAEQGFLELCEGNVIDNREIRERIKWCTRVFSVHEICFDRYNTREMSTDLAEEGHACIEIPQLYNLSEPTKKFLRLVATGKLKHGGNPILKWNAHSLSTKPDGNDNIRPVKPDRERDKARIDGIAAAITAMSRAIIHTSARSAYEELDEIAI
jgi:phage terminase large subunit-like protein